MVSSATDANPVMLEVLAWLLTYAIHSTVLIGAVWLAVVVLRKRISHETADALWKTALVGGLLTSTLQIAAGLHPVLGTFDVGEPQDRVVQAAAPASRAESHVIIAGGGASITITTVEGASAQAGPVAAPTQPEPPGPWPLVLTSLFVLGAAFGLIRLVLTARRLRAQLRGRRDVIEDPLLETFLQLCQRVGITRKVRLTTSPGLRSPVALWRREICVPERAVTDLGRAEQETMLAHELAHVVRRDPAWLLLSAVIEAVFFFQPLNRVARKGMQEAAEYLADDWAVQHTGGRVALAKCLAEVATWLDDGTATSYASPMAGRRSPVRQRVRRLLHGERPRVGNPTRRLALTLGVLAAVAWLAPGVSAAAAAPQSTAGETTVASDASIDPHVWELPRCRDACDRRATSTWYWRLPELDVEVDLDPLIIDLDALVDEHGGARWSADEARRRGREARRSAREAMRRARRELERQSREQRRALRDHMRALEREHAARRRAARSRGSDSACSDEPELVGV